MSEEFRDLMAGVCSPVSILTTVDEDGPHGVTVSSLASLSLDPPLVSVALDRRSRLLARVLQAGRFGVNVLAADQGDAAAVFARSGIDRFAEVTWSWSGSLPRLDRIAGWAVCELWQTMEAGDHLLLAGQVVQAESSALPPLVYGRRTFGTHSNLPPSSQDAIAQFITAMSR
jgi:flavin reductase (DIM6/NTAB) family NADH-FMN oxidoreductase RutF